MGQINFAAVSHVSYAIIVAGIAIALLLRILKNRRRQVIERRRNYYCLTSAIPLGIDSIDQNRQDCFVDRTSTGFSSNRDVLNER